MSDITRLPGSYDLDMSREPEAFDPIGDYLLISPDCRTGDHSGCTDDLCEDGCHIADNANQPVDIDSE